MSQPTPRDETAVGRTLDLLAAHGDAPAFIHHGRVRTYADVLAGVRSARRHLAEHGVRRGSVVAVLTGDRPETFMARWAANALGAAVVVVPDGLSTESLSRVLETCGTTLVVTDAARSDRAAATGRPLSVVPPDDPDESHETHGPDDLGSVPVEARAVDVASIRLTGGSTGVPRAIPRRGAVPPYLSAPALEAWRDTVQLLCTPVAHLAGTLAEVVLAAGGHVVLQEGFDPAAVLAAVERHRVSWIWLQPRHLHLLLDHPDLATTDTSSLRSISLGSAPSSPRRLAEAIERFGPIVSSGYGTQETNQITWLGADEHRRPDLRSTVGRPLPGVEVSIRDADEREVTPGGEGEIWVRGAQVVEGYLDPTAEGGTAEGAFRPGGWFRTGDLGTIDDAGYLTVVGRTSDVILAEHGHVHPTDVEELLLGHPDVTAAGVVGLADADGVETVAAAVVARAGTTPDPAQLRSWVGDQGTSSMVPATLRLVDELPVTGSGKVDRAVLRAILGAAVDGP